MTDTKARVDKITFKSHRPERKKPEAGDKKIIKGVMHVRCYNMVQQYGGNEPYCRSTSNGKPDYVWLPESEADLNSFLPKRCVEHNRKLSIRWKDIH